MRVYGYRACTYGEQVINDLISFKRHEIGHHRRTTIIIISLSITIHKGTYVVYNKTYFQRLSIAFTFITHTIVKVNTMSLIWGSCCMFIEGMNSFYIEAMAWSPSFKISLYYFHMYMQTPSMAFVTLTCIYVNFPLNGLYYFHMLWSWINDISS